MGGRGAETHVTWESVLKMGGAAEYSTAHDGMAVFTERIMNVGWSRLL